MRIGVLTQMVCVVILLLAGCGADGSSGAPCGTVQPCGGDVVGRWMFTEACETSDGLAALQAQLAAMAAQSWCPTETLRGVAPVASGSLTFDASGAYSISLAFGGSRDLNIPASCLAGVSCAAATTDFQSQIAAGTSPHSNVSSVSCSGSTECLCRETVSVPQSEAGTYSISGNILTFAATTGDQTVSSFCVEGSSLHLVTASAEPTGQTVIRADLV